MQQEIGRALLVAGMNIAPELEEEFNQWYNQDHVPERLMVPGFLSARRFVLLQGEGGAPPKYLCIYELEDENVLQTDFYKNQVASPSEWTQKMRQHFQRHRWIYRQVFPALGAFSDKSGPKPRG